MNQEIIRLDLKGVNCYLGKQENGFVLFDTGGHLSMDKSFNNRREALDNELIKAGVKPGNLRLIVLTHGDCDHTANAAYLRDKYQAKIAMHEGDVIFVKDLTLDRLMQNFKFRSLVYKLASVFIKKTIRRISAKIVDDFDNFSPDLFLKEGDDLSKYGFNAQVLYTPGHTEGSIAFLTESGDIISGDTFANVKKPGISPNALDFKRLKKSVERMKSLKAGMVYPGHGEPFKLSSLS